MASHSGVATPVSRWPHPARWDPVVHAVDTVHAAWPRAGAEGLLRGHPLRGRHERQFGRLVQAGRELGSAR